MVCSSLRRAIFILSAAVATVHVLAAANISPIAAKPRWQTLERYQETITHDEFTCLLQNVYATRGYGDLIEVGADSARIREDRDADTFFTLRFAQESPRKLPRQYWRQIDQLGTVPDAKPLLRLHVALDPGHIGGKW